MNLCRMNTAVQCELLQIKEASHDHCFILVHVDCLFFVDMHITMCVDFCPCSKSTFDRITGICSRLYPHLSLQHMHYLLTTQFYFVAEPFWEMREYTKTFFGSSSSCLLYTSPSPRDKRQSRMPSSA